MIVRLKQPDGTELSMKTWVPMNTPGTATHYGEISVPLWQCDLCGKREFGLSASSARKKLMERCG